ncbi:S41 family peptidase [bacterium]|nr:S41 family peptidase [bacterium]
MKKRSWLILLVGLLIAGVLFSQEAYKDLDIFAETFSLVRREFVDPSKIEVKPLMYGAIRGMLSTLNDPFTRFMEPEKNQEMQTELAGSFGGLGITITIKDDKLMVVSPLEDTPAYKAGIKAEDIISEIEGTSTKGITIDEAVKKLRGPKGTQVTIAVIRKTEVNPLTFTLTRDIIKIKSVKFEIIDNETAYIRITSFNNNTIDELSEVISKLQEKNPEYIIVDLRNNGGGTLQSALGVSSRFLGAGTLVVSTKGRNGTGEIRYVAENDLQKITTNMIVLVNEGSASGAEILAGAIKDNKRGFLLGKKTFGKASVQTVHNLSDGSAIALTTAHYYTPGGFLIHEKGIEPNVTVEQEQLSDERRKEIEKLQTGTYTEEFISQHNPYTEDDIKKFIEELKKAKVNVERRDILRDITFKLRKASGKPEPLVDIYYDTQLQRALELFHASKFFQKKG